MRRMIRFCRYAEPCAFWRRFVTMCVVACVLATSALFGQTSHPELKPLGGHAATVTAIVHTPSGKYIATASADQTLKIWDAAAGEELRILEGHTGPVLCVAASPDNRFFVSGAGDNTLRIWDAPQPDPLQVFVGHTAAVRAVAVSFDGQRFVTAGDDSLARIWRIEDGKLMVALDGLTAPIRRAAYRHDNNQTALGDEQGILRLFNAADGKPEGTLGAHVGSITGLAYHPNNQQLISTGADGLLKVWRLPVLAPRQLSDNTGPIRAVAITANNQQALAADERAVRVFNPANGQPIRTLEGIDGETQSLTVSANNAFAAASDSTGRIHFWNLADGASRPYLHGHDGAAPAIAFHPGNELIASAGDDGLIRVWRIPQPATSLSGHTDDVLSVAVSNGQMAATGSADKTVRLWNATNGQAIRQLAGHAAAITAVAFPVNAPQLASGDAAGEVRFWNPNDGAALGVLGAHAAAITAAAFHPSGNLLATTDEGGLLKLWRLPLSAARPLPGHNSPVTAVAVSNDGAISVTGSADAVRIFDNAAGAAVLQLEGHEGPVTAVALHGGRVAAANEKGVITVWTFPLTSEGTLQPQPPADGSGGPFKLLGHAGKITDLAFDGGGERLVSSGADGSVRVWRLAAKQETPRADVAASTLFVASDDGELIATATKVSDRSAVVVRDSATGKTIATLLGHAAEVRAIAFSKDKKLLLTGAADKTARLWDLADAKFPQIRQFDSPAEVLAVALSEDASQVFVGCADHAIRRWSAAGMEVLAITGHTAAINALEVRGNVLFSGSQDATVRLWSVPTGSALRTISHGSPVIAICASDDGAKVASAGGDSSVKLFNAANGAAIASLTGHASPATSLHFNSDGSQLVTTSADGLRIWDADGSGRMREQIVADPKLVGADFTRAEMGEQIITAAVDSSLRKLEPSLARLILGHEGAVNSVAVTADGRRLVSGGADKTVRLWSVETGAPLGTLAGPAAEITSVSASSSTSAIAAACADGNLFQWTFPEAFPAEPLPPIRVILHSAPLRSIAFGGEGKLLAACGNDNLVRVYDAAAGYELERFAGHTASTLTVAVAETPGTLLTGGADNSARLWTMSLERTIVAHKGKANDVAFTPDGSQVATAGADLLVKFFSPQGQELRRLPGGEAELVRLAVTPDGTKLAALDVEGRVIVWNSNNGAVQWIAERVEAEDRRESSTDEPRTPEPRGDLSFSADGQKLLIAHESQLRFVDARDGRVLQQFDQPAPIAAAAMAPDNVQVVIGRTGGQNNAAIERYTLERVITAHKGAIRSLAVSPDGATLLSGGDDRNVRLWNWSDGALVRQYAGNQGKVASVAFTKDGARAVAGGEDGVVRVWPVAPLEGAAQEAPVAPQAIFDNLSPVHGVAASFDNARIAACGEDGVVRIWELASGRELERFLGHKGPVHAIAYSPDGATIVSGGTDKTARAWSISAQRLIVADGNGVEDLVLMAGGVQAVTAGATAKRWNLADGQLLGDFSGEAPVRALAMRGDGAQLAAADRDGKLYLWNANDGSLTIGFKTAWPIHSLGYSPDNLRLIAACGDQRIRFFNSTDGRQIQEIVADKPVNQAIFLRDGRHVLSVSDGGAVRLWAFVSPESIRTLAGHGGPVYAVAVSSDGRLIVSASGDQTLRIWDAATGAQLKQMSGHQGPVYGAAFSADGALIVSCGADKSIRLWDVLGGRQLKQIPASDASLYSVTFHTDGRRVAAAGLDKKICLYDVITGELQATLTDHNDYVNRVAFNARGDRLLSVGYGGNLVIRDAAGKPLYHAELHRVSNFADLSPDGARLVVSVGNGDLFLLETPSNNR